MGYTGFTGCLSIRLSVRPSVCRQSFQNFLKKELLAPFISYLAFTLIGRISWPLYIFVFLALFGRKWRFWNFLKITKKNNWLNSFHTWHLPLWGESLDPYTFFVFLATFSALWWPNIWPKMGFLQLSEKMINIEIFIGYFWMRWVVIRAGACCPHLWAQVLKGYFHLNQCANQEVLFFTKLTGLIILAVDIFVLKYSRAESFRKKINKTISLYKTQFSTILQSHFPWREETY